MRRSFSYPHPSIPNSWSFKPSPSLHQHDIDNHDLQQPHPPPSENRSFLRGSDSAISSPWSFEPSSSIHLHDIDNHHLQQPHPPSSENLSFLRGSDSAIPSPWSFGPSSSLRFLDIDNHRQQQRHPPTSENLSFLHRSNSASLLQNHDEGDDGLLISERADDIDLPPIRRAFSTEEITGNGKFVRYNAEERRKRVERYRNKRNQRNFQKKVTVSCSFFLLIYFSLTRAKALLRDEYISVLSSLVRPQEGAGRRPTKKKREICEERRFD